MPPEVKNLKSVHITTYLAIAIISNCLYNVFSDPKQWNFSI